MASDVGFQEIYYVGTPDMSARKQVLDQALHSRYHEPPSIVNREQLIDNTEGQSPSDIKNVFRKIEVELQYELQ